MTVLNFTTTPTPEQMAEYYEILTETFQQRFNVRDYRCDPEKTVKHGQLFCAIDDNNHCVGGVINFIKSKKNPMPLPIEYEEAIPQQLLFTDKDCVVGESIHLVVRQSHPDISVIFSELSDAIIHYYQDQGCDKVYIRTSKVHARIYQRTLSKFNITLECHEAASEYISQPFPGNLTYLYYFTTHNAGEE